MNRLKPIAIEDKNPVSDGGRILSTENNDYAVGLNDENEWFEDLVDTDVSLDDEISDYFEDPDESRPLYNEYGFDKNRL